MDGGGKGWCMARCVGGAHGKSIINRTMLGFRPIAPKPDTGGSVYGGFQPEKKSVVVGNKLAKRKRKYVKVSNNTAYKRKKRTASDEERKDGVEKSTIVTLQLLPEKTDRDDSPAGGSYSWSNLDRTVTTTTTRTAQDLSTWLNFSKYPININDNKNMGGIDFDGPDRTVVMMPGRTVVESWVTVECVTGTCMDCGALGNTDVEKRRNLEVDTCPGFISDGCNRVEWVNEAYKRMMVRQVGNGGGSPAPETIVWLIIKERFVYPAFTCRVRVLQYTCGKEKWTRTVPCDTWRMDCGGFAWRLDVEAALSLGR